jgi:membrane-associated phospholipid phosphatase
LIAHDNAAKKITLELIQAGIYSEAVTEVFKIAIGRARPYNNVDAFTFHPFTVIDDSYHSMPSGHTTAAMALSTVMSRHAHSTALKILAYVPAAFTMFSRIYQGKHWLSDIVPGAAIGFLTGNWVVDLHEGKKHRINVTSIYPVGISYALD